MTDKAGGLRRQLGDPQKILVGVGVRDALEARLVERAHFDFVWASSFCIAASYGLPDEGFVAGLELLRRAAEINQAVGLPVVLDSDLGYSSPEHIGIVVPRVESAGIAGICLEDKSGHKTNSLDDGAIQELSSPVEFAAKISAAVGARSKLVVIARVEAFVAGRPLHEVLERAEAYEKAGADCIIIHSRAKAPDEVVSAIRAWDGAVPLGIIPTTYELNESTIPALGKARLIIYANQLMRAGVRAQVKILQRIRTCDVADDLASVAEIFALQRHS